jgi:hypothetical protein
MKVFGVVSRRVFLLLMGFLVVLAVLLLVSPVWALESRSGNEVVIGPDEVIEDDLYVTANEVVMEGAVEGDLIAFGSSIAVDGTVQGDLISAGRSVEIGAPWKTTPALPARRFFLARVAR